MREQHLDVAYDREPRGGTKTARSCRIQGQGTANSDFRSDRMMDLVKQTESPTDRVFAKGRDRMRVSIQKLLNWPSLRPSGLDALACLLGGRAIVCS